MTIQARVRPSVVIADHDPSIRSLYGGALRDAGLDVLEAPDGASALDLSFRGPVDLMVLDLDMPDMSGLEVIATLRQGPETAMVPIVIVTAIGDEHSLVDGLGAGADDFLAKPVRLDELVARVRARLRADDAWTRSVEAGLRSRTGVVAALGRMTLPDDPTELAEAVVREIGKWTNLELIAILGVVDTVHLRPLGTYSRTAGVEHPGLQMTLAEATRLLSRTVGGPWAERPAAASSTDGQAFLDRALAALAVAPFHSRDRLLGVLILGTSASTGFPTRTEVARLLGSAIDYANVLGVVVRKSFDARIDGDATRDRLRAILDHGEFDPVFQPIVEMPSREIVGYEALTRFADGSDPADRFAEAAEVGIGFEYEIAAVRAAVGAAADLPSGGFLTLNVSPQLVVESTMLCGAIDGAARPIVLEITEHAVIEDYSTLRSAMLNIEEVQYAVDDAGAGYASFRHILELAPTYAKLDRTIIRAIESDPMRQALVAGLDYFALRTRCQLIAEGVETEEEAAALVGLGVALAQGYLFGRPAPAA